MLSATMIGAQKGDEIRENSKSQRNSLLYNVLYRSASTDFQLFLQSKTCVSLILAKTLEFVRKLSMTTNVRAVEALLERTATVSISNKVVKF